MRGRITRGEIDQAVGNSKGRGVWRDRVEPRRGKAQSAKEPIYRELKKKRAPR